MNLFSFKKNKKDEVVITKKELQKAGLTFLPVSKDIKIYTAPLMCNLNFTLETLDHEKIDMELICFLRINYKKHLPLALVNFMNKNKEECEKVAEKIISTTFKLPSSSLYTYNDLVSEKMLIESRIQHIFKDILQHKGLDVLSCEYKISTPYKTIKVTAPTTSVLKDPYEKSMDLEDTYEDIFASMHKHKQKEIKIYSMPFEPKSLDEVKNAFVIE